MERHLQLEVHYSCCDQLQQECAIIRNHVLESIRLTEEKLHIREGAITKVDSFLCSCGEGRAHHICAYNPETHIVECEVTGGNTSIVIVSLQLPYMVMKDVPAEVDLARPVYSAHLLLLLLVVAHDCHWCCCRVNSGHHCSSYINTISHVSAETTILVVSHT